MIVASAQFCRLARQMRHPDDLSRWGSPSATGSRSGLSQAEVAENEEHYHHDANNVENAIHVEFSFLSCDRITVPLSLTPKERELFQELQQTSSFNPRQETATQ